MSSPSELDRRPDTRVLSVERLVERTLRGRVRIPSFQRGLRWKGADVLNLLDSIYRGYPVGALLLWQRPAPAETVRLGPLKISAPEAEDAWWVVDGQQRLTALTASLAHELPLSKGDDAFRVYFDARSRTFEAPPEKGKAPEHWVPVPLLLDATELGEWTFDWSHRDDKDLRRAAHEAGRRLREYSIPLYIVDTPDEEPLREIFYRINNKGRALTWTDVHDALHGSDRGRPSTLGELAKDVAAVGMGRPKEDQLLTCLVAARGLDPTQNLAEHRRKSPDVLDGAAAEAAPAIRRALVFLRNPCGIVHLGLLPYSLPLQILVRLFIRFPELGARSRVLVRRWVWRTITSGILLKRDRTLARRSISALEAREEEEAVQRLVALVPESPPRTEMPPTFDARSADSRLYALALARLTPLSLRDGHEIDVAEALERYDVDTFARIIPMRTGVEHLRSPANRILNSGPDLPARIRELDPGRERDLRILTSHAVSEAAYRALNDGREEDFIGLRADSMSEALRRLTRQMTEAHDRDRPSIRHLLERDPLETRR